MGRNGAPIKAVEPAPAETWDRAWQACDYATYFHSREWAELWRHLSGGSMRPDPLLVHFRDDTRAILPLSTQTVARGLITVAHSSPGGTFGGWISSDNLNSSHGQALASILLKRSAGLNWRINPYDPNVGTLRLPGTEYDTTHCLSLAPEFSALVRTWSKGHRAAVKQAQREGVTVRVAQSIDDWRAYYRAYLDSVKRWGDWVSTVYQWNLFDKMHAVASPNIRLWVAICDGEVIGGMLCFYAPRHVVYWHGAALADFFSRRPVNLLVYSAVHDACARGFRWFDFNPSGGFEGVRQFKRSFGAEELACPVVRKEGPALRLYRALPRFWG